MQKSCTRFCCCTNSPLAPHTKQSASPSRKNLALRSSTCVQQYCLIQLDVHHHMVMRVRSSRAAPLHIYIYIYVHVYLLNAAACMSACMGTLNLLSRVTASTSTIIRRTTYVMRVLQCARASSMQTSKQSLHEVTSGTANHCVEDNSQVSIKHRIYMLTAGIKRCASCLN